MSLILFLWLSQYSNCTDILKTFAKSSFTSCHDLKSLTQKMCEDINSILSFTNGTFYNVGFEVIVKDETGSFYNRYYGDELSITTIADQVNSNFADRKKSITVNIPDILLYADTLISQIIICMIPFLLISINQSTTYPIPTY